LEGFVIGVTCFSEKPYIISMPTFIEIIVSKTVTFLTYEDPLGKDLAGTVLSFTVLIASVLALFVKHQDTPIVRANNHMLTYTLAHLPYLLLSLLLPRNMWILIHSLCLAVLSKHANTHIYTHTE
jgi:hypothetical protein